MQLEQVLFCEMARNEASGQVSLIGYYVGDEIAYETTSSASIEILPNLHCVVVLGDMDGIRRIRMQCQVRFLDKEVLNTPEQDQSVADPKKFFTIMFGFSPFPLTQGPGDYEFRFVIQPGNEPPITYSKN